MSAVTQAIRKHLKDNYRGLINFNDNQIQKIVDIVLLHEMPELVTVKRSIYCNLNESYQFIISYSIRRTDAINIIKKIGHIPTAKQIKMFYKFEIPELGFSFYSVNINLFPDGK